MRQIGAFGKSLRLLGYRYLGIEILDDRTEKPWADLYLLPVDDQKGPGDSLVLFRKN